MESKSEGLYEKMRASMDQSNTRVDAQDALNDIKARMEDLKASGEDAGALRAQIDETIAKYGTEFPEVSEVLQPIANELAERAEKSRPRIIKPTTGPTRPGTPPSPEPAGSAPAKGEQVDKRTESLPTKVDFPSVKISKEDAERWSKQITDKGDTLGKQDQLGMVHLQDLNAQLNRAKDVASALMASADKAADNIVAHIS
jgi:hypothetical protein